MKTLVLRKAGGVATLQIKFKGKKLLAGLMHF